MVYLANWRFLSKISFQRKLPTSPQKMVNIAEKREEKNIDKIIKNAQTRLFKIMTLLHLKY
jgi:hypothetical protein